MRTLCIVAFLLLAGCSSPGQSLDVATAEAIREEAMAAAGPEGDMRGMTGDVVVTMAFDGQSMRVDVDFQADFHTGDAFSMDATIDMDGDFEVQGGMQMLCTPERLIVIVALHGDEERIDAYNPRGSCLDTESADFASLFSAFEGIDGFDVGGLDALAFGSDGQLPYTSATKKGDLVVARYKGSFAEYGLEMRYEGVDTFHDGRLEASRVEMSADAFDMDFVIEASYSYGPRSPAPSL